MATDAPASAGRLPADERRQQLIDTATRLFAQRGFSGTTTRQIARAAGVNEAIIFRFFPHKDDLYAAILEQKSAEARSDALIDTLHAMAAEGDDAGVIRTIVSRVIEHHRRDPEFLRLMLHSSLEDHSFARQYRERHFAPVLRFLFDYVRARQQQGRFQAGPPEPLVRAVIGIPAHHGLSETLMPEAGASPGDVVETYTTFILKGLAAGPTPVTSPQPEISRD
ncbi:MAG: TetR/AcrR family transcriptional regulator [Vicinamibacterales bacterium]